MTKHSRLGPVEWSPDSKYIEVPLDEQIAQYFLFHDCSSDDAGRQDTIVAPIDANEVPEG